MLISPLLGVRVHRREIRKNDIKHGKRNFSFFLQTTHKTLYIQTSMHPRKTSSMTRKTKWQMRIINKFLHMPTIIVKDLLSCPAMKCTTLFSQACHWLHCCLLSSNSGLSLNKDKSLTKTVFCSHFPDCSGFTPLPLSRYLCTTCKYIFYLSLCN